MTRGRRGLVQYGSLTTQRSRSSRTKSGRRCRVGAHALVAGVSGRHEGALKPRKETASMIRITVTNISLDGVIHQGEF